MAKVRSPNYPAVTLSDALEAVRPAFKAEHRNKMGKMTLAKHLGYSSLNGRALAKIGAVRAYGLIEGSGDELRISDDAVHALMAPEGSDDRSSAMMRLAQRPTLFKEIRAEYPSTLPSEDNLRFWLIKQGFIPDAAGRAAATYLETMRLVGDSPTDYPAEENPTMERTVQPEPPPSRMQPTPPFPAGVEMRSAKDEFNLMTYSTQDESRVRIAADLNLEGIKRLYGLLGGRIELMEKEQALLDQFKN